jgi:Cu2+-exporting ATPase
LEKTFDIQGMSCAACEAHVQKAAAGVAGVESANVNLLKNSMVLSYDGSPETEKAVVAAIEHAGYGATPRETAGSESHVSAEVRAANAATERAAAEAKDRLHRLILSIVFSVPLFYVAMGPMFGWPQPALLAGDANVMAVVLTQMLLCIPILVVNRHFFSSGLVSLFHGAPNMDSLIAVGSGASFVWSLVMSYIVATSLGRGDMASAMPARHNLYFDSAGMILTLISLGKYFEARAKGRTTDAISSLMDLAPKTATVIRDGQEVQVPTEQVRVGDRVVVRTGGSVPVDGVVVEGTGAVDESALTGESVPVEKAAGDHMTGATVLRRGYVEMEATAVGDDTTLAGILRLVDQATSSKAPIERQADRIAGVFVPIVLVVAAVTFVGWIAAFAPGDMATALTHAISVLVISCPCALGLATPTAVMVGTGRGAANGILIKDAASLETAGKLTYVVLDKTGTITEGKPEVTDVACAEGVDEHELVAMAGSLEARSEHPLAEAVCAYANEKGPDAVAADAVEGFTQVAGGGIVASMGGQEVLAGNARLMADRGIALGSLEQAADAAAAEAKTPLFFARGGRALGMIAVADVVKPTSATAIRRLRAMGVHTVMLTGDQAKTAEVIGREVGVDQVIAGVLPDQKEQEVRRLQEAGELVAMVGDGVNDAPALARADVGIAIGAGTDVAINSADVVLMRSDPADVATSIELSRATMRNIRQNLFWALFYNTICIPVAMGVLVPIGITLNPMIGAAAMGFSSVFVVSNALRLRTWKPREVPAEAAATRAPQVTDVVAATAATDGSDASSADAGQVGEKIEASEVEDAPGQEPADAEEKGPDMKKTKKLNVEGMMCDHCVAHVTEALEGVEGVSHVKVSLKKGEATLKAEPTVTDDALVQAVKDAGYDATVAA